MNKTSVLHLDFETFSKADLLQVGLHVYAEDESTDVLCAAYWFDDHTGKECKPEIWFPGVTAPPKDVMKHILQHGDVEAWNAAFEYNIWNRVLVPKYNVPSLFLPQMICTMAKAYAMALPGSLEKCAAVLGVDMQKDMEGSRLMKMMCKPKDDGTRWSDHDQEKLIRLGQYCMQDVRTEVACGRRLLSLSNYEQRIWILDQEINARGVKVDLPVVKNAAKIMEEEKIRLDKRMREITHNNVAACTAVKQIKDFIGLFGIDAESLNKASITELLKDKSLHPVAREVLELRSEAGKASTAKLDRMANGVGSDGRLRGSFQYSGANTRRWAGRQVQLHNLPRHKMKASSVDLILRDIARGISAEDLNAFYGQPFDVVSQSLRGMFIADKGKHLIACDFSAIEARVLAWLAGQEDVLGVFRKKQDIYKVAASSIFGVPIEAVTDDQRQVGKVAILALGYQGGVGAFQQMAKGYGVKMEPAYDALMHSANLDQRKKAQESYKERGSRYDISEKEFLASDLTKILWREANPKIVSYWNEVNNAAINAILKPNTKVIAGAEGREVTFLKNGSFLFCRLPSGGTICYAYPSVKYKKTPWGTTAAEMRYKAEDGQSKEWMEFGTYGGSLVENITQATARDILADAMLRLDAANYPTVIHVHDELVVEMDQEKGSIEEMSQIMCDNPPWAKDLPIAAGGWMGHRFRK